MKKLKKVIALDCDGVLLDYNPHFAKLYADFFQVKLDENPGSYYHCHNKYVLPLWDMEHRSKFYDHFSEFGFADMQPMPYALEACQKLHFLGFELVCVTNIKEVERFNIAEDRLNNLQKLGFPIEQIYCTGHFKHLSNRKKETIEALAPEYFVDDLETNFAGLTEFTKCVLINPPHIDNPNVLKENNYLVCNDLIDFFNKEFAHKKTLTP